MKNLIISISAFLFIAGCGPKEEKLAQKRFQQAQELMEQKEFNKAKLHIDTLEMLYPDQIEIIAQGRRLMATVALKEQERNLAYYDSLAVVRKDDFERLRKNFILQDSRYEGIPGKYVHKRQTIKSSHNRTYLRANLLEDGVFYISSHFFGNKWIYHNSIKVYDEGIYVDSQEVPEDGFLNRRFDDSEFMWETIMYKDGRDNGIVKFISENVNKRLKVRFNGKNRKFHYIILEKYDKEAIRDAYLLSTSIKDLRQIEDERMKLKSEIERLRRTL